MTPRSKRYSLHWLNPFEHTAGSLPFALDREEYCIRELAKVGVGNPSIVTRGNAEKLFYDDETFDAVVTDPPYYSSIYYADLSAFFYVWLKRLVGDLYPDHFALPAPPKRREAVAQPSEHAKKANAQYQDLMRRSFAEARRVLKPSAPLVCVYAHRTTEGRATLIRALVEGVVLDVMLDEIFGLRGAAVGSVDPTTRFYILWRFTYRESSIEAGDAYVFCYPQGIEMDGPDGLAGPSPSLVEKSGSKFRVRTFEERGRGDTLGIGGDGRPAPLIDVIHRLLWLLDHRPVQVREFLKAARPSQEQLRLVTQALCAPVLGRPEAQDAAPTAELRAISKLNADWRSIVEGAAYDREVEGRSRGQAELALEGNDR